MNIGLLSCLTGGETYYYPNFDATRDGEKFAFELKHNLTREFGYNALMRIRCSNGLLMTNHIFYSGVSDYFYSQHILL